MLKIKVLDTECVPESAYENAAGIDLKIAEDLFLAPGQLAKVGLGVQIQLGADEVAYIVPRSSCSGFRLENTIGVIDPDYRGILFAKIRSTHIEPLYFPKGTKLLQMTVHKFASGFTLVDKIDEITQRGSKGDGSSGK